MSIWFTSDEHYGHRNVIRLCGRPFTKHMDQARFAFDFSTAEMPIAVADAARTLDLIEMTDWLIAKHNSMVAIDDTVYHMGDFSMNRQSVAIVKRLNGRHGLVMGNHDKCHMACAKTLPKQAAMIGEYHREGFELVAEMLNFPELDNATGHHMPWLRAEPGEHGQKHERHRLKDNGRFLIHGHVHQAWRQRARMINVGVDAWGGRPVHIDELRAMISAGPQNLERLEWTV